MNRKPTMAAPPQLSESETLLATARRIELDLARSRASVRARPDA